ncbi:hypothetical protein BB560_000137 [Smittium megazygosporum]|uniref:Uncharacterized protein n=1 Tax=Smittium megazygosporum TaxID=133381 RepID=A0A2T9ZL64_9FUNG|nr:hypothetical protein BB560_000137 [Smittium megazygosporum]
MALQKISNGLTNALIYSTLGVFLIIGLYAGRKSRKNLDMFIKSLYSQGTLNLSLNFLAVNAGASMFISLPEVGTIAGVLGVVAYSFACIVPIIFIGYIGPVFRKHNPENWSMSSFIVQRFGPVVDIGYLLVCILFMFLYTVGELTTIYSIYGTISDINPLIPVIILCAVTTTYSAFGGVLASFLTDGIQITLLVVLLTIASISIGLNVRIPQGAIQEVGLLKPTKLGWELFYILTAALMGSSMFHQGFWQRAFSAKTSKSLKTSCWIGATLVFVFFTLVGMTGVIAAWSGVWSLELDPYGGTAFFYLLGSMPKWLIGVVTVAVTCLSCCAMDTLTVALAGNLYDLFRQKIGMAIIRVLIILIMVPVVVVAKKSPDVLSIFLLADLLACATVFPILLGLMSKFSRLTQVDVVVGGIAGILGVGVFGTIYLGNASEGWHLLLLPDGLYSTDGRVLGAFLTAPIASIVFALLSMLARFLIYKLIGKKMPNYEKPSFEVSEFPDYKN